MHIENHESSILDSSVVSPLIPDEQKRYVESLSPLSQKRYWETMHENSNMKKMVLSFRNLMKKAEAKPEHKSRVPISLSPKKNSVATQLRRLESLDKKIDERKTEIAKSPQIANLREKLDTLTNLKRILTALSEKRDTSLKCKKIQEKEIKKLVKKSGEEKRKQEITAELERVKSNFHSLTMERTNLQRDLRKNHNFIVNGTTKERELLKKLEEIKKDKEFIDLKKIKQQHIDELQEKLNNVEGEEDKEILQFSRNMQTLEELKINEETKHNQLKKQIDRNEETLKDLESRIKEIEKMNRHGMLKPIGRPHINYIDMEAVEKRQELRQTKKKLARIKIEDIEEVKVKKHKKGNS